MKSNWELAASAENTNPVSKYFFKANNVDTGATFMDVLVYFKSFHAGKEYTLFYKQRLNVFHELSFKCCLGVAYYM